MCGHPHILSQIPKALAKIFFFDIAINCTETSLCFEVPSLVIADFHWVKAKATSSYNAMKIFNQTLC